MRRDDVSFVSEGNRLRGWLFVPDGLGPFPAVVLTPGFAGVKEGFLGNPYHEVFAAAGLASLVYDHACCGESDGEPRQELDPIAQQRGYHDAVTFLTDHPDVDADRIGIWGTSYSGGHVLAVAAADRRVRCVVSQGMTISGHRNLRVRHTPSGLTDLRARWEADRRARMRGEAAVVVSAFGEGSQSERYNLARPEGERRNWRNEVTLRSWEHYDQYEPAAFIERIAPTPLLMIVALDDTMTPAADALEAYERALHPKRLVTVRGDHYAVYGDEFDRCATEARDWFVAHL